MLVVTRRVGEPIIIGAEELYRLVPVRVSGGRVTFRIERWYSVADVIAEHYPACESDNKQATERLYKRVKRLEIKDPEKVRPFLQALLFQALSEARSGKWIRKRLSEWLALPDSARKVAAEEFCRRLGEEEAEC